MIKKYREIEKKTQIFEKKNETKTNIEKYKKK
jgi:hypothetical protein